MTGLVTLDRLRVPALRGALNFLDTCRGKLLLSVFEVNGRQRAVVRVLAFRVVEQFDVLEHVPPGAARSCQ